MYKAEMESLCFKKFPDWSKFSRGRGLENAVELLTCKCSLSNQGKYERVTLMLKTVTPR